MDKIQQTQKSNKILITIKNFELMFYEEFQKCGIKRCGYCRATGLIKPSDLNTFCTECYGIGYVGYTKIFDGYVCKKCHGCGCWECEERGWVDWITNAMGREANV